MKTDHKKNSVEMRKEILQRKKEKRNKVRKWKKGVEQHKADTRRKSNKKAIVKKASVKKTPVKKTSVRKDVVRKTPVRKTPARVRTRAKARAKARRRLKPSWKIAEAAFLLVLIGVMAFAARPQVKKELTKEAGSSLPEVSEFLLQDYKDASFVTKMDEAIDMNTVADYEVVIAVNGKEYITTLHVEDTVAPVVATKNIEVYNADSVDPAEFIENIEDATKTEVEFAEEPDLTKFGKQTVTLQVTDAGGNSVEVSADLEVIEDTTPPVIEGVKTLSVAVGGSISYKKDVTVTDDYDENVKLTIDNSDVDLNEVGDYTVTYIAEDAAGNVTEETATVHVKPAGVSTATEDMVNEKADAILKQIISDDMSQYEKAKAIFFWVHENVAWSDSTPKTTWVQGAYRGLFDRKGDCFVYANTSKCLLTRAGITNMDIGFENPRRIHVWNLIDIGEGWYHFDTTRRADGSYFFYSSDETVRAYSQTHDGSHAYDSSQYPAIQ